MHFTTYSIVIVGCIINFDVIDKILYFSSQVLSLLLATILRSLVSSQRVDHDIEEDYDARSRMREPLLNPHPNQASGSTRARGDDKVVHNDIWSSRMREKVGL